MRVLRATNETDDETGDALYWHNEQGWVPREQASTFENDVLMPVMGSVWEPAPLRDDQRKTQARLDADDTRKPQKHLLSPADMLTVQDAITADGEVAGILALWEIILGSPLDEEAEMVRPGDYVIPARQWEEIAAYMVADDRVREFKGQRMVVLPGFTMVNQGPGSYEDEQGYINDGRELDDAQLMGADLPPKRPGTVAIESEDA